MWGSVDTGLHGLLRLLQLQQHCTMYDIHVWYWRPDRLFTFSHACVCCHFVLTQFVWISVTTEKVLKRTEADCFCPVRPQLWSFMFVRSCFLSCSQAQYSSVYNKLQWKAVHFDSFLDLGGPSVYITDDYSFTISEFHKFGISPLETKGFIPRFLDYC